MKKVFMIISILTITVTLSACGGSGKQKEPSKESQKSDKYDYVYYEILKDKKGKSHIEKADLDHVYEHILGDGNKKPYIVKDGKKIHVYRPPYMIYGDDDVEGKAVSKDEVTK